MRKVLRSALFLFLFLLGALVAPVSADDRVVTLRIASLDAVLADAERISAMVGEPRTREELRRASFDPVGIGEGKWIDESLPIVITLPSNGLMNMGWFGALPVRGTESAMTDLAARLGEPVVDGELRAFETALGTTIHVRPVENYLIFGQSPEAVRGAVLKQVLDAGSLPPGNVVVDLDLVPLTAMAQFGMAAARQGVADNLELDESDTGGREAALSMYDLYVGVVNDILLNSSRLQLSYEIGSDGFLFHEWLLPRTGSTLEGLLKAQKGGFPDVARRLNVDSAVALASVNVEFTKKFRTAMKEFAQAYAAVMDSVGQSVPGEEGDWFLAFMGPWMQKSDRWVDCTRGDAAVVYDFGKETGFRVTQVAGLTAEEGCGDLLAELSAALAGVPALPDGRSLAVIREDALQHAGVQATRIEMDLDIFGAELDEDEQKTFERMFGEDGYVSFMGMKDDLLVSVSGAGSEEEFKRVVDDLSTKKTRGGMTPAHFEPLKAGNGLFFALDLGRALREIAKFDTEDEDLQQLSEIADQAGRWVLGVRLDADALRIETSVPLAAFGAFAALDDDDDHEEDHDHGDPEHHDKQTGEGQEHQPGHHQGAEGL